MIKNQEFIERQDELAVQFNMHPFNDGKSKFTYRQPPFIEREKEAVGVSKVINETPEQAFDRRRQQLASETENSKYDLDNLQNMLGQL